jgi:hypothetical protein
MLDLSRYLLGVAELLLLAGFAGLGGSSLRRWLLPRFNGAPALLSTTVIALALLVWAAEVLGSFGLFEAPTYLACVVLIGSGTWALGRGSCRRGGVPSLPYALLRAKGHRAGRDEASPSAAFGRRRAPHPGATRGESVKAADGPSAWWPTVAGLLIAGIATIHFAAGVKLRLSTGMTGFDSTWYHGPFAAGFFQSGSTWELHFIAPQFLAWFYPANAEVFPAAGMLAFGRDVLSPLVNLGWFLGCLLALWCIGRPYRVAPWSLAFGAVALSLPVLSDQAGEARNDIAGIFFLLAAAAIALNDAAGGGAGEGPELDGPSRGRHFDRIPGKGSTTIGAVAMSSLAAGLAAGTKLNFLLPAAVLIVGLAFVAPRGSRWRALWVSGLAALAGGGYWYLRNLVHTGNPLPWFGHLGPISLPAPEQALGGREGHSVFGYLTDGGVWSGWFLPGLHHGLTILWPLLAGLALAGLILALNPLRRALAARFGEKERRGAEGVRPDLALSVAALAGLAAALAWLIAPTSASGPTGMPRGFESGLRYLTPALVIGLALLPVTAALRERLPGRTAAGKEGDRDEPPGGEFEGGRRVEAGGERSGLGNSRPYGRQAASVPSVRVTGAVAALLLLIAIGYPIQRHYLQNRYANPTFAAPGLDAAFKWANEISNASIATTGTRQYPLYGRDLSNHVQYVGVHTPHGGFVPPTTCRRWRTLLDAGHYDYVVATRDRIEPDKPPYPATARWTAGPWAEPVLSTPPTKVYKLTAPPDPSTCP